MYPSKSRKRQIFIHAIDTFNIKKKIFFYNLHFFYEQTYFYLPNIMQLNVPILFFIELIFFFFVI